MDRLLERLLWATTAVILAVAVSQGTPTTLVASVAVVALGMLLADRFGAVALASHEVTVGGRARAHKESLAEFAAPRHPATPGRPRTRAPALGLSAA